MRSLALSLPLTLALAAPAVASDNGEGLAGEIDDEFITFFSFGVLGFFVLAVTVGTLIQARLERRKEQQKAHALRRREGL